MLILLLLLLLLGGLLAWAFMRLNDLEDGNNSANRVNATQGTGTSGTGSGSTSGGTRNTTGGGSGSTTNTTGGSGGSGSGSTTTIECPEPAQRVTLPNGTDVCVTVDPFPDTSL